MIRLDNIIEKFSNTYYVFAEQNKAEEHKPWTIIKVKFLSYV